MMYDGMHDCMSADVLWTGGGEGVLWVYSDNLKCWQCIYLLDFTIIVWRRNEIDFTGKSKLSFV